MSIDSILKKEGVSIVRKLDILEVNSIAKNVSTKINKYFSQYLLNSEDLFSLLCRIDMYIAKMPSDSSVAKYLYKNNSMYFNEDIDLSVAENSIFLLHECIHFLQLKKDSNGNLFRLGLYNLKNSGEAINEAAVQLMASTAQEQNSDFVKYYDININTISPDCYPLQCALLNQMIYFTGTYPLYQSTLNSNDVFKSTFISCSDKKTYTKIENNLDKILKLEDDLYCFSLELSNADKEKDIKLLGRLIADKKNDIRNVFFETQNLIIQNCFTHEFDNISNMDDVNQFQNHLYNFKDVLCYTNNYTFYNDFYRDTMLALDSIRDVLERNESIEEYRKQNQSLVLVDSSFGFINMFKKIIQKLRKLFYINKKVTEENFNMNK